MPLKLEVGKSYLNGYNQVVKIVSVEINTKVFFPYWSNDDQAYTEDGRYSEDNPRLKQFDLVQEVTRETISKLPIELCNFEELLALGNDLLWGGEYGKHMEHITEEGLDISPYLKKFHETLTEHLAKKASATQAII